MPHVGVERGRPAPSVRLVRRLLLWALPAAFALAQASAAAAYPWPVKPFDQPHAIRGNLGDPRTVFSYLATTDGLNGPGDFAFHNGVDIAAPGETPVYPVTSGTAHVLSGSMVVVDSPGGHTYQYIHIQPLVFEGEHVTARQTVLGSVLPSAGHVHLTELSGGHVVNPLVRGHLTPYRDKTRPTVRTVELRDPLGLRMSPLGVSGRVSIVAEIYDKPPVGAPPPWKGLPVAPAFVAWRLDSLSGRVVVPETTIANFLVTIPPNRDFWTVYARGTYQNMPRFATQYFAGMPGRYLYMLDPDLDTHLLANGVYQITVNAVDTRGNLNSLSTRFTVVNSPTPRH